MEVCYQLGLEPLPMTDFTWSSFAAFLTLSVKPGTIKAYLSAVRNLHVEHGYPDPIQHLVANRRLSENVCGTL